MTSIERPDYCQWIEDEDGVWDTGCGNRFGFDADGPRENKQHFCGYCGGRLIAQSYVAPSYEEDEAQ